MRSFKCSRWIAGALFAVFSFSAAAELVFSAPPRQSMEDGKRTFEPVAKLMSDIMGERVVYHQPTGWPEYTADMRAGKYDIVFDGPHFAAWRIKHLKHVAIAKLPGTLDFVILTRWDDKRINRLRDIASKQLCGLASPNLGTMTVMSQFDNPVLQPELVEIKGGFDEVITALREGKCRAAVVRDNAFKKLADEDKKMFKVVFKSPSYPNQTFTVGDRLKPHQREQLLGALTNKNNISAAELIFAEFSKSAKFFIAARSEDFTDMEFLLEGVVWGW